MSSSWLERYADRVATVREAVSLIKPGRRLLIGSGAAEPLALVHGLIEHGAHLVDNDIVHLLTLGPAPYVHPEYRSRFRHSAFFIGSNVRRAVQDGRADFIPVFLSEIPELIRSRRICVDVALIQVSPPDSHGYVSLGVSVDVVRAAVESAELVLAEVNPRMPRTHGDSFVPVEKIDKLIPVDAPLMALDGAAPGEVARRIGRFVATLIPDGATIQTGIGQIPNAVLQALTVRNDLGVHTEMLSDGMMNLARSGVITGAKKTLLRGKMVTSFVMGSQDLYAWAGDNPAVEMRGSDFTNDPMVIARNDQMVSINSALAVDLTGQVASDTLSGKFFSGIGGQVDFVRGASRSRGGKAIIALPSTAKRGSVSRIQASFEEGAGVVTSRGDVRYVVTEYGVADLWGKSVRERALALTEIANPDFRSELLSEAKKRRFVFMDQRVPRAARGWERMTRERLRDGAEVLVRLVRMSDEESLQRLFYQLSNESVYRRFLAYRRVHPHADMQHLVDTDDESSMGLVALEKEDGGDIIAMSRYDVEAGTRMAEIACVVRDDWQRRGLGTLLLRRTSEIARARGLAGFRAMVLGSNTPMLTIFHRSGFELHSRVESGVCHLEMLFPEKTPAAARADAATS